MRFDTGQLPLPPPCTVYKYISVNPPIFYKKNGQILTEILPCYFQHVLLIPLIDLEHILFLCA